MTAVRLRVSGFSWREIEAETGVPAVTVRKWLAAPAKSREEQKEHAS